MSIATVAPSFPMYHQQPLEPLDTENEEGLGYAPDLDEPAHAAYATGKNLGHGHILKDMGAQCALAHQADPWPSLSYGPVAHHFSGLVGVAVGNGLTMPLAGLAMKNGWGEWRESKATGKKIGEHLKALENELQYARSVMPITHGKINEIASALADASELRIKKMNGAKRAANLSGKIGKYSFLSGGAIMARCVVELGRNGVLFLTAPAAAMGGAAALDAKMSGKGAFTITTGLISNVLAPVAAIFALLLGVNFVKKTKISRMVWTDDLKAITEDSKILAKLSPHYHNFVLKKMKHRTDFFKSFTAKNRCFVAGAALYSIGSVVPVCIKLLAACGIESKKILNPKVLLAMYVAAVTGAVIMGIFSAQFFFGHPKQDRYDGYAVRSTPELDRRFLTSIDVFSFYDAQGQRETPTQAHGRGFAMREAVFTMIRKREELHRRLVSLIAEAQNRAIPKPMNVEDAGYAKYRGYRMKAKILLFPLRLRVKHATEWASRSSNYPAIVHFFKGSIEAQIMLLEKKKKLQARMEENYALERPEQRKLMEMLSSSRKETVKRLDELNEVLRKLYSSGTWQERKATMKAVLESQGAEEVKFTSENPLERHIGEFFVKTMPAETAADRGTLLEVERDAGEMRRTFVWK